MRNKILYSEVYLPLHIQPIRKPNILMDPVFEWSDFGSLLYSKIITPFFHSRLEEQKRLELAALQASKI